MTEKREHNTRQELHDVAALAQIVDDLKQTVEAVTGIPAIHRALTRTDPNNDWSVQEYAMCMGVNRSTVYTWINSGRLRHYKAGGRIRIPFGTDPTPKTNPTTTGN